MNPVKEIRNVTTSIAASAVVALSEGLFIVAAKCGIEDGGGGVRGTLIFPVGGVDAEGGGGTNALAGFAIFRVGAVLILSPLGGGGGGGGVAELMD